MRLLALAAAALAGLAACSAGGGKPGSGAVPPWGGKPPPAACAPPVQIRDVSSPTAVVGGGTAASCTEEELRAKAAAVDAGGGGILVFDCGSDPVTITLSSQLVFTHDTVLDGGGLVTLSGGGTTRILYLDSSYDQTTPRLWVQRLTFSAGASAREAGGDTASGGAAIYRDGGSLTVVDCAFVGNHAPATGPDLAGGAIYAFGGGDTVVVGSTFIGNSASDGGAIGSLNGDLVVVNSAFSGNEATGTGGNPGDGGCGGALYQDGAREITTLCGVSIQGNRAGAIGGGVFRVSNSADGTMTVDLSAVDSNAVTAAGTGDAGGLYLEGLALTVTRTTVSRNSAWYGGGLWVSGGSVQLADSTVAANEATVNGGGLWLSHAPPGAILNCTIADNQSTGADTVAGAIFGTGPALVNTIVSGNTAPWSPGCSHPLADGGGNLEWPDGAGCAAGALVADPILGPLGANGGATETLLPAAGSPARGLGTMPCPAVDQRGVARATPCTAGAVEVP
ncbi:MAG TPA: choice-of-anchor Q domain-containing protein [Anaeromyxobacter sp.]|nr:choice-of-anchor Q domain-containing protein [Anaeromyxobacter sp.]